MPPPTRSFQSLALLAALLATLPFFSSTVCAQSLDQLDSKKGVTVSGSLGANAIAYTSFGGDSRRDPFDYFLTGSLNIGLFGYSIPLSFNYSNKRASYTQPFNSFELAPSYKWVKAYFGTASMNFSGYTLGGHRFTGVGVEVTPGKWQAAAMYGKLKDAISPNLDSLSQGSPSYKRMGYGAKVGYIDDWGTIGATFFTAKDDERSIGYLPPEVQLTPMKNYAVSINFRTNLLKYFYVAGEYAFSVLSKLQRSGFYDVDSPSTYPAEEATEQYFDAISAGVGFQNSWMGLQLNYERVAPDYQTLGAYYFTNDMENYTIMPMLKLLGGKVNIAGNIGIQRDNLGKTRSSDTRRFVGAANASYNPNEQWNFSGSYSNFNSYTRHRLQDDPTFKDELDSLNFYQISQSLAASAGYNFGSSDCKQGIMLNLTYQTSHEEQKANPDLGVSNVYAGSISYLYAIVPLSLNASVSGNLTHSSSAGSTSTFVGPSASLGKGLFKNLLRASWGISYSYNTSSGSSYRAANASSLVNRLNLGYSPKNTKNKIGRHNAGLSIAHMQRFASGDRASFSELTATLNYTYSF